MRFYPHLHSWGDRNPILTSNHDFLGDVSDAPFKALLSWDAALERFYDASQVALQGSFRCFRLFVQGKLYRQLQALKLMLRCRHLCVLEHFASPLPAADVPRCVVGRRDS